MRRFALPPGADHEEIGTQIGRDIRKLVPRRPAPYEWLDVHALVASGGHGDGLLDLGPQTGSRILHGSHPERILVGVDAGDVGPALCGELDRMIEGRRSRVTKVGSNDDPPRRRHRRSVGFPRRPKRESFR
jgi:hypothetical protein